MTKAHIELPELKEALAAGRVKPDGTVLLPHGQCNVTKVWPLDPLRHAAVFTPCLRLQAAVEPVWYLPGVAERFGTDEGTLRQCLFHETNGMYPELITRPDLKVFLPPIGGLTVRNCAS